MPTSLKLNEILYRYSIHTLY